MQDVLAPFAPSGWVSAVAPEPPLPEPPPAEPEDSVIILPPPTGFKCYGVTPTYARPIRLEVWPTGDDLIVAWPYGLIQEIAYEPDYSSITLVLVKAIITLAGQDLKPVAEALINQTCRFIAPRPVGEKSVWGEPVITGIETQEAKSKPKTPPVKPGG